MQLISRYFPKLTPLQIEQFSKLKTLYEEWNEKINLISRQDIGNLEEKHLLHSLSIAKLIQFKGFTKILDVGTGGGFPGIPLAIMFPEAQFHLVDSIGKKIKVVADIIEKLELKNVTCEQNRVEKLNDDYEFVVSRAVAEFPMIYNWTRNLISQEYFNTWDNGWILLKGGEVDAEFKESKLKYKIHELSEIFEGEFFETKKLIYVKAKMK